MAKKITIELDIDVARDVVAALYWVTEKKQVSEPLWRSLSSTRRALLDKIIEFGHDVEEKHGEVYE